MTDPGTEASIRELLSVLFLRKEQRMQPYYQDEWATLYHGDCREVLPLLGPVDLVLTDMPYGTTRCDWDEQVGLEQWWKIVMSKCTGRVITTSAQPFTTDLINSNRRNFRYCLIWDKVRPVGFQSVRFKPLMRHEDICIFGGGVFLPVMQKRDVRKRSKCYSLSDSNPISTNDGKIREYDERFPQSILEFSNASNVGKFHPTQKPVPLFAYLCETYSKANATILDPFAGSGTTLVAAKQLGRKSIGIEIEEKYCAIAADRLRNTTPSLFAEKPKAAEQPNLFTS